MKTYQPFGKLGFTAAADLTKQILIGIVSGNVCGNGAAALGALELDVKSGKQGTVVASGTAIVLSGASLSAGAKLQSNASGKVITYSSGEVVGYALNAATAADQEVLVKLV